jgi:hypothetical protein
MAAWEEEPGLVLLPRWSRPSGLYFISASYGISTRIGSSKRQDKVDVICRITLRPRPRVSHTQI